jgi:hypothetical protein
LGRHWATFAAFAWFERDTDRVGRARVLPVRPSHTMLVQVEWGNVRCPAVGHVR